MHRKIVIYLHCQLFIIHHFKTIYMHNYQFNQDYTATGKFNDGSGNTGTRKFTKGEKWQGEPQSNGTVFVTDGRYNFDIPKSVLTQLLFDSPDSPDSLLISKSFFTTKNVVISLLVIGIILGGLKLAKVF